MSKALPQGNKNKHIQCPHPHCQGALSVKSSPQVLTLIGALGPVHTTPDKFLTVQKVVRLVILFTWNCAILAKNCMTLEPCEVGTSKIKVNILLAWIKN